MSSFSDNLFVHIQEAVTAVRQHSSLEPEIAIILGSGLGPLADEIEEATRISYQDIPHIHSSSAPGHAGNLILGRLAGRKVVAMQGRIHLYEGMSAVEAAFPVRVMHALGAQNLLVSNACGGLNPAFRAGSLMLQLDFINQSNQNALTGANDARLGERFPVMFDAYDPEYLDITRHTARQLDIHLYEGIYLAVSGPSYATRAELRMLQRFADAIGMSTVHEVTVARHEGMRVLGISSVTDMALPDAEHHTTGDEVVAMAERSGATFRQLVKAILPQLA